MQFSYLATVSLIVSAGVFQPVCFGQAGDPALKPPQLEMVPWEMDAVPQDRLPILVADLDGDGRDELAYYTDNEVYADNSNAPPVALLIRTINGDTTFTTTARLDAFGIHDLSILSSDRELWAVDLNGDGRLDILSYVAVYLQTDEGWDATAMGDFFPGGEVPIMEFGAPHLDGDAYPDLLLRTETGYAYALGSAAGFGAAMALELPLPPNDGTRPAADSISLKVVHDLDGDGLADQLLTAAYTDLPDRHYAAINTGDEPFFTTMLVLSDKPDRSPPFLIRPLDARFEPRIFTTSPTVLELELPIDLQSPLQLRDREYAVAPIDREIYFDLDGNGTLDATRGLFTNFNRLSETLPLVEVRGRNSGTDEMVPADINGDGVPDLVGRWGTMLATHNPPSGVAEGRPTFGRQLPYSVSFGAQSYLFPTDLNEDGRVDLVGTRSQLQPEFREPESGRWERWSEEIRIGGNVMMMQRARHPGFARSVLIASPASSNDLFNALNIDDLNNPAELMDEPIARSLTTFAVADLNGDGADELIAYKTIATPEGFDSGTAVWRATAGSYEIGQFLTDPTPTNLVAGDFDGDGDLDVAGTDETLTFLENDGVGGLTVAGSFPLPVSTYWLVAADFDGDGDTDLIGGGYNGPGNVGQPSLFGWRQLENAESFAGEIVALDLENRTDPWELHAGDFNRDGVNDLLIVQNAEFTNRTAAVIVTSPLDPDRARYWAIRRSRGIVPAGGIADINNDGLPDVLLNLQGDIEIAYSTGTLAGGCVPDVNYDGVLDLGDIGVFVERFLSGFQSADYNGDTILDLGDISLFVEDYLAGC